MNPLTLWLCLFVASAVQQVSSSDHQLNGGELRDVASVINGGPLKPLSFIEKSITKDIDLLVAEIGKQLAPINSIEDIDVCVLKADKLIDKYIEMFRSGRITKKRIDERNSLERAAALLGALPLASERCDLMSYLDLVAIFKAASGDSGSSLKASDQIRASIVAAFKLHRANCSAGYYGRFQVAFNDEIDASVRNAIAEFFDSDLIGQVFPGYEKNSMVVFEAKNTPETLVRLSNRLLDRAIKLSSVDLSADDEDRFFTQILPGQLLAACKSFIQPLEGILLPAKIDMALADVTSLSMIDPKLDEREFVDTWARFHICASIHYNEPAIVNGLKRQFSVRFAEIK